MIIAFVGCINDESQLPISGNGKTCAMTGYCYLNYLQGKTIYTNYETDFSIVQGFQKTIEELNGIYSENTIIAVTEMQKIIDAIGADKQQTLFIDSFAAQLRKCDIDLMYDTQRFNSIQKRLRIHTDVILMPLKTHLDSVKCGINNCKAAHKIYVYSHKPFKRHYIKCFDATKTGQHYNSLEFINDSLNLVKVKK